MRIQKGNDMHARSLRRLVPALPALLTAAALAADLPSAVKQSARDIPIAADADLAIAGGSCGAVAAAVAAAKAGAKVVLAMPCNYAGEDLAGTMRLWREPGEEPTTDLARAVFARRPAPTGVAYAYKTDRASDERHKETSPPSRMNDGVWGEASHDSTQYAEDVTYTIDLGRERPLRSLEAIVYRGGDYGVGGIEVTASADGMAWAQAGAATRGGTSSNVVTFKAALTGTARHLRCKVIKAPGARRILIGEIIIQTADGRPETGDFAPCSTPQQAKAALDAALTEAGVTVLPGCFASDLLRDGAGKPAGFVIANRAGRQAVRARVTIDATEPALLARQAGAEFRPFPAGKVTARHVVLSTAARDTSPGIAVRRMDWPNGVPEVADLGKHAVTYTAKDVSWYEYAIDVPVKSGSWPELAALEQTVRDCTYTTGQVFSADSAFLIRPDTVKGSADGEWKAFRPAGVERVWVLGSCADLPRDAMAKLLRPVTFMEMGSRLGAAAAAEAKAAPAPAGVRVAAAGAAEAVAAGDVREPLAGLRPLPPPERIPQEAGGLPVFGHYDVVVAGGGTAGAPAGIAAARQGARTLVIEYQHGLGGVGTLGMIGAYYCGNRVGFTTNVPPEPVEVRMEWYRREIQKAGGDVWFGALACGVLCDGARAKGVVVATPAGRGVVLADVVIDGTGNSDLAIPAGASFMFIGEDYALQNSHVPKRIPGKSYLNGDCPATDDADPLHVGMIMHTKLQSNAQAFDLGAILASRERRRIIGDYVLDWLDIACARTFPDTIMQARSSYDSHGYQVHPYFTLTFPERNASHFANVPYRTILPKGVEGMLVVGLGMSAHRDAMPITRMQPDQHNLGYAAGVAAAMAVKAHTTPRQIDVRALQRHLVDAGNVTPSVLTDGDSFPPTSEQVEAAVRSVTTHYRKVEVLLARPDQALPLLRQAFAKADGQSKTIYAHVLAALGDPTGVPALIEAIRADTVPMPEFGDRRNGGRPGAIRALSLTRDARAVPLLLDLARDPKVRTDLQLTRAVALALGRIGDPTAAEVLADMLGESDGTAPTVRDLFIATALFHCGDRNGRARAWLEACVRQNDGTMSRLAWDTLNEKPAPRR